MADLPTSLPESTPASPVPDSVSDSAADSVPETNGTAEQNDSSPNKDFSHLPPEHREVVQRLYQKVKTAIETIGRLRAENERLRERIAELEAKPDLPEDEAILALDDDPDEVRERITQFINTIDTYLDTSASDSPTDATPKEADA